ncbi:MAG: hypothetical protein WDW38_006104 [Sanguina aurantia]
MLIPAFHLHLNEKIQRGQATIGKYDGKHAALTCATTAGKIFLHQPHLQGHGQEQLTYLNINKQITALVAGLLGDAHAKDMLLVGTHSNLQCYDVDQNKDMFFKDIPDGVNSALVGAFGMYGPMAIVGGNCSIQGFGPDGSEDYWTVTGDNVSAMAFCDVDQDGRAELLVGSDDFDIRIFQGGDVIAETSEADTFVGLCAVWGPRFGYALVNGTIGVYEKLERVWRVKSKHSVCAIASADLDGDGVPELISGWGNGRMEVRKADTGEVIYRDHLASGVSAILKADYRNDGAEEVVLCGAEGEVRGYLPLDSSTIAMADSADFGDQQSALADLTQRKQELVYELTSYQASKVTDRSQVDTATLIPQDTRIDSYIAINRDTASCDLILRTSNDTVIRGVVVFGEQIFAEESLFVYPKVAESKLAVALKPIKDVAVVLMIKVLVGQRTSAVFHVFELEIELPKFSMYAAVEKGSFPEPTASVTFSINERVARLANWIETRFSVKATSAKADVLEAFFLCLRDRQPLVLKVHPVNNQVQVTIKTDNMDLAGEAVQDLAAYLGILDLQSTADFPVAMTSFKEVLQTVDEHNLTRLRMNADMADSSNLIKTLLIRAEDVRILGDMKSMKKFYRQLFDLNRDLIADHDKRATNHKELLDALKEVNQMIQRSARLRVGGPKTRVVAACRAAIKVNNMASLFKIIREGDGTV